MSEAMAFAAKDLSGTLFRNDRRTNENHPHAKGKILVAGRWYYISAWTKTPQGGGEKFQSLALTEMTDEQAAKEGGHRSAPAGGGQARDDVPGSTNIPRNGPPVNKRPVGGGSHLPLPVGGGGEEDDSNPF